MNIIAATAILLTSIAQPTVGALTLSEIRSKGIDGCSVLLKDDQGAYIFAEDGEKGVVEIEGKLVTVKRVGPQATSRRIAVGEPLTRRFLSADKTVDVEERLTITAITGYEVRTVSGTLFVTYQGMHTFAVTGEEGC